MVSFVEHLGQFYGRDEIVFSVHQVINLGKEYKLFGFLSIFPWDVAVS